MTLFTPGSPGYEAIRRPVNPAYREVRPRLVGPWRTTRATIPRLTAVKNAYDPHRFFDFPQAI